MSDAQVQAEQAKTQETSGSGEAVSPEAVTLEAQYEDLKRRIVAFQARAQKDADVKSPLRIAANYLVQGLHIVRNHIERTAETPPRASTFKRRPGA